MQFIFRGKPPSCICITLSASVLSAFLTILFEYGVLVGSASNQFQIILENVIFIQHQIPQGPQEIIIKYSNIFPRQQVDDIFFGNRLKKQFCGIKM